MSDDQRRAYINKRRGKYLAQTLEAFERDIEKHLPRDAAGDVQSFKALVRQRFAALAQDSQDILDFQVNALGQELRDRLHALGRP